MTTYKITTRDNFAQTEQEHTVDGDDIDVTRIPRGVIVLVKRDAGLYTKAVFHDVVAAHEVTPRWNAAMNRIYAAQEGMSAGPFSEGDCPACSEKNGLIVDQAKAYRALQQLTVLLTKQPERP